MTIRELNNRLKSIDLQYMKEEAVFQNRDKIAELNKEQLHQGLTSKGTSITPFYRKRWYAQFKASLPSYEAPNNVPDLYLNGDFYNGIDVEIADNEYSVYSKDEKADDLSSKYRDILGLTEKNIETARTIVTKTFVTLMKRKLLNN
jgi:hypothetical protein